MLDYKGGLQSVRALQTNGFRFVTEVWRAVEVIYVPPDKKYRIFDYYRIDEELPLIDFIMFNTENHLHNVSGPIES